MHGEFAIPLTLPLAFVLVLARVAGAFVYVPLPGRESGPGIARTVFALATAIAMFPRWPRIDPAAVTPALLFSWVFSEAGLGISIGLMVSFLTEVLQVLSQLTAGLLFFAIGLDRFVLQAFAQSLERYPPGSFVLTRNLAQSVIELGSDVFSVGLRLAFPVLGLLLMTEISLALVGRMSAQLHLGAHAAPVKLLLTLVTFAAVVKVAPQLYEAYASRMLRTLQHSLFG
jgi:flagellar biosynthesis protein FliR